ncbi:MAG: NAD(P)H-dependent oxidoreductase [Clostridiales bacterium]
MKIIKILVISGSPKSNGNTLKVVQKVEKEIMKFDENNKFEYINLNDINLGLCKGCYMCLSVGQEKCPLKDDQKLIENKMDEAEALIFTSPVYVANVSGLFKNFLDRFAYICHRPRYHGKKAMIVSSTGAIGDGIVNIIMKVSVETWGFSVVSKLGAVISTDISEESKKKQNLDNQNKIVKAARKFYNSILLKEKPSANFTKLLAFNIQKASFKYADPKKADFIYWSNKCWLKKDTKYYTEVKINPIKYIIVKVIAFVQLRSYPKGKFLNDID